MSRDHREHGRRLRKASGSIEAALSRDIGLAVTGSIEPARCRGRLGREILHIREEPEDSLSR